MSQSPNEFGIIVRNCRVDAGELISDMAKYLGITCRELQEYETSENPMIPSHVVSGIIDYLDDCGVDSSGIQSAAERSNRGDKKYLMVDDLVKSIAMDNFGGLLKR